jgi:cell division protein ZapE
MSKSKLNLLLRYQAEVNASHIQFNKAQTDVLTILEQSYLDLFKWRLPWQEVTERRRSVYIYGTVGSGKTYVMDLFYQALPSAKKWRIHFHDLMEHINQALKSYQGQANPMQALVKDLALSYQVICIDELMVHDVVQAMLFLELLPALMDRGLMLVFTSNTQPSELYLNGLQRQRFMKVIEVLESGAHIFSLSSQQDYRQQRLPLPDQIFFFSASPGNQDKFKDLFHTYLTHLNEQMEASLELNVQGRTINCLARSQTLIWFSFNQICQIPRCQRDYMELVKTYKVFFISELRFLGAADSAALILWMYFIDVLYNAQVKLILLSDVDLTELYPADGPLAKEFKRCLSRMQEMQSQWYWDLS